MAKILIVDDDQEITNLFERFLSLEGFETKSLNESALAVDVANSMVPDLFILDLMMPPPDGFKLCRMLRAEPKFSHTPIIIITALDDTDSKLVAFGAGANDYITKPFHVGSLIEKMREFLD